MKDNHDEVFDLFDDEGFDFEEDVVYTDEFDDEDILVDEEYDDEEYDDEEYDEEYDEVYDDDEDIEDEDEEDDELFTRKSVKKSGSGNQNGGSKKGILIAVVAVLAIVLIAVAIMTMGKSGEGEKQPEGQTTTEEVEQTTEEQTTAAPETMAADTKPEVKTLMEQYYAAVKAADLAALGNVIDSTANISLSKMEKRAEYIEDYQNLSCYTLDGKDAGTYLVFVAFDMKFVNIDTMAPAMDYHYLKSREDGSLYVCTEYTQEEMDFMSTQRQQEVVLNTIQVVNDRFDAAVASDTKLYDFVQLLYGGGEVTTAAPDETTAAPEVPAETPAPQETPAATQAPQETPAATQAPETTETQQTGDTAVTTDKVRFRSSMDTSSSDNVIGELDAGTKLKVIEIKGDWCLVSLADNADKSGYIHKDFLSFN